jgi:D-amino-acid oxidase
MGQVYPAAPAAGMQGRGSVPLVSPVTAVGAPPVTVVGAGVVGLTCALRLTEAGHRVRVVARERLGGTTSSVAAAMWLPYRALPYDRVLDWGRLAYDEFVRLAADEPVAGVVVRSGVELQRRDGPEPWWAGAVPGLVRVDDVPDGFVFGWRFPAPVIDMTRYLPWLEAQLADRGVIPEPCELTDLTDVTDLAAASRGVVVNCSGLGARWLVPDPAVTPVRGQVVLVDQIGLDEWIADESEEDRPLTYVVPRIDDVVVGGTAEDGAFGLDVDPDTASDILRRATELVPALAGARVLGHKVGLRPARPTVRLEAETVPGADAPLTVVHCYGHGGAGVTLSWGCAAEVVALVDRAVDG